MEAQFDHNKLLKKIAKKRLKPYGINQQGNSRTFLYDGNWYVIVIEFQPSGFGKGTYLNIGVDLNFFPREYLAFCYGDREKNFEEAIDEKTFTTIINTYCDRVIEKTEQLKLEFTDIFTAAETVNKLNANNLWSYFDLSILYGLMNKPMKAKRFLNNLIKQKCQYDYEFERQKLAIEIGNYLADEDEFVSQIKSLVTQTRKMKKLPVLNLDKLIERNNKANTWFFRQFLNK